MLPVSPVLACCPRFLCAKTLHTEVRIKKVAKKPSALSTGKKQTTGHVTKFKIRCSRYLYTLSLDDPEKAAKLQSSLPPGASSVNALHCPCELISVSRRSKCTVGRGREEDKEIGCSRLCAVCYMPLIQRRPLCPELPRILALRL